MQIGPFSFTAPAQGNLLNEIISLSLFLRCERVNHSKIGRYLICFQISQKCKPLCRYSMDVTNIIWMIGQTKMINFLTYSSNMNTLTIHASVLKVGSTGQKMPTLESHPPPLPLKENSSLSSPSRFLRIVGFSNISTSPPFWQSWIQKFRFLSQTE